MSPPFQAALASGFTPPETLHANHPIAEQPQEKWNHRASQEPRNVIDRAQLEKLLPFLDPEVTLDHDWR
jgi:hypothetical protein